jgi:hypothetical protein
MHLTSGYGAEDDDAMEHQGLAVASKGSINATFRVPGATSLPSDGNAHNVTIAQLDLDAEMSWIAVPKIDPKTHLKVSEITTTDTIFTYTFSTGKNH